MTTEAKIGDLLPILIDQGTANAINTLRPETNARPGDEYHFTVTAVKAGQVLNGIIDLRGKSVLVTDVHRSGDTWTL